MNPDPFGTADIRARVLAAWSASPARFREDANAEEELVLGAYRDRLVVELAQNAADAAARAGTRARLSLVVDSGTLVAANTGTPLDAAGVEALATLRASAKRAEAGAVGRFGVGFAAVRAVSDAPRVVSASGAVRWSEAESHALVADIEALRAEVDRRHGVVPALRLPFADTGSPPEGFDTAVVLPLRDAAAERLARRLLTEVDDALLLGLPGLAEVSIDLGSGARVLRCTWVDHLAVVDESGPGGDARRRWHLARASGALEPGLLAGRPVEERERPWWSVTWAVTIDDDGVPVPPPGSGTPVLHAPTPTDEPLGVPALLIGSFPLDSSRRHVVPGPLLDVLVRRAADAHATLLRELPAVPAVLRLVPGPVPAGPLDARVRDAILDRLGDAAFLPSAADPGRRLHPRDAVAVAGGAALVGMLAEVVPGLLPPGWHTASTRPVLATLGVRFLALADVVDLLAPVARPPEWWHDLYGALADEGAGRSPDGREALGALPVVLADGRTVRGPRGLLLPGPDLEAVPMGPLGLRVVHPAAAHPLLEALGARVLTPRAVLDDPMVHAAVAASAEAEDPRPVADAVLALVAAADLRAGEEPWLGDLALPDDHGEHVPADDLVLPGSPAAHLYRPGELGRVAPALVDRWGAEALRAVGVVAAPGLVTDEDVVLDVDLCDHDLDGEDDWVDDVLTRVGEGDGAPVAPTFQAVRDLDLVADEAWADALALLARPPFRDAVVTPIHVSTRSGRLTAVPSYSAWWLSRHPVVGGRRPTELRLAGVDPLLAGLYDDAPDGWDVEFLRAVGVRSTVPVLLAEPDGPAELLEHLVDPERTVTRGQLRGLLVVLADVDPERVDPPRRVRALVDGIPEVVAAGDAVVVDAPDLLPLLGGRPLLVLPPEHAEALADVLDVALAGEVVSGRVGSAGVERPVPALLREVLPSAPSVYLAHDRLVVDGRAVSWRYVDGVVHADGDAGLARGVAWACGAWERRHLLAALLRSPRRRDLLLAEHDLDRR